MLPLFLFLLLAAHEVKTSNTPPQVWNVEVTFQACPRDANAAAMGEFWLKRLLAESG